MEFAFGLSRGPIETLWGDMNYCSSSYTRRKKESSVILWFWNSTIITFCVFVMPSKKFRSMNHFLFAKVGEALCKLSLPKSSAFDE